ncbi:MAG: orotidine-5'-phosphate decarboxylase [Thermoanaerobacterales bacterium]|nr:orotidine-5'-phosphate decarboxylase [Thermoanaerobacterales bacterium]
MHPKDRLLVALDVDGRDEALALADCLRDVVGGFKVGMRLFYRQGPGIVSEIAERSPFVFLDLKLHDIPQTVGQAVRALVGLGAAMLNVHAGGGAAMLRAAAEAAAEEAGRIGRPRPLLVAVTVLTSLDDSSVRELGFETGARNLALRWAELAMHCGLDGVVASAWEASAIRVLTGPQFRIVSPGVRPAGEAAGDQRRVATPAAAVSAGADYLVIGRPITGAPDPVNAARRIVAEMGGLN